MDRIVKSATWISSVFQVTRCKPENFDPVDTAELPHFCNASESGYGTVSYLRLSNHQGKSISASYLEKTGENATKVFEKKYHYSRKRWRLAQYLANLFWRRWTKEYLLLMQKSKWNSTKRNFSTGYLVIVDNSAPMGHVVETFPDANDFVRSVLVKTKTIVIQQPIDKLCLLIEAAE